MNKKRDNLTTLECQVYLTLVSARRCFVTSMLTRATWIISVISAMIIAVHGVNRSELPSHMERAELCNHLLVMYRQGKFRALIPGQSVPVICIDTPVGLYNDNVLAYLRDELRKNSRQHTSTDLPRPLHAPLAYRVLFDTPGEWVKHNRQRDACIAQKDKQCLQHFQNKDSEMSSQFCFILHNPPLALKPIATTLDCDSLV